MSIKEKLTTDTLIKPSVKISRTRGILNELQKRLKIANVEYDVSELSVELSESKNIQIYKFKNKDGTVEFTLHKTRNIDLGRSIKLYGNTSQIYVYNYVETLYDANSNALYHRTYIKYPTQTITSTSNRLLT